MLRGERFELNVEGSGDESDFIPQAVQPSGAFVGDILERQPTEAKPPTAPVLKSGTGFPGHRKRRVESRFIRQTASSQAESKPSMGQTGAHIDQPTPNLQRDETDPKSGSWVEQEKQRIDEENRQRLAEMTPDQIQEERRELLDSLSPAFIGRLLKRANIDSGSAESDLTVPAVNIDPRQPSGKTVTWVEPEKAAIEGQSIREKNVKQPETLPHDSVHFPRPPQPPALDPASDTFLEDLHAKYFPSLPSDPDKLAWMQSSRNDTGAYDPSATALNAKDIRFSFTGELIAPRTAAEIPVTAGLHHHGDAPESAGYTIAELAHLSRSTYPAQRCIAFQTLGRLLYRLGKGEFGDPGEPDAEFTGMDDSFGELARGLWREIDRERVIDTLVAESDGRGIDGGRHTSAKAYAMEAVHLWHKGGGRRWKAS